MGRRSVDSHTAVIDRFELVMREVLTALERRYDAFFQQIDRLCDDAKPDEAAKVFAKSIPLSPILQHRFYTRAPVTEPWIEALRRRNLFSDRVPPINAESEDSEPIYLPWLQRIYLIKAAGSPDAAVRAKVIEIVRKLASTQDLAVLDCCVHAVTALPATEAAQFTEDFVAWLNGRVTWPVSSQAVEFVKVMASANLAEPAFRVAKTLFAFDKDQSGSKVARFDANMYGHHVKLSGAELTRLEPAAAFELFVTLLIDALKFRRLLGEDGDHDHSVAGYGNLMIQGPTAYEEPDALFQVTRDAAIAACSGPAETRAVIARLRALGIRLFDLIALDLAARHLAEIPEVADNMLLDPRLMDGYWCRSQYAALARVRLPAAAPELSDAVLELAYAIPDRYADNWRENRRAMGQPEPTATDVAHYRAATVLEILFQFRDVLPPDIRDDLDKSAKQYGVEPHIAAVAPAADGAASEGKFIPFPAGSTGALMEEAKAKPEAFFVPGRLAGIPNANLWVVFDGLKDAQSRGASIDWDAIFAWIDCVMPAHNRWPDEEDGRELRSALVAALLLIAANLELGDKPRTPPPYRRLADLVLRLWAFSHDPPASEFPWADIDPAGASFRTVSGLSLLIGFRMAFLEPEAALAAAGVDRRELGSLVYQRMAALIQDPDPAANLCRGQIGMWFSDLLDRAPDFIVPQIPTLFGAGNPADIRPAWHGYVHRARSSGAAVATLEPFYRAAIERVGDEEPDSWGDLKPSSVLGHRIVRDFMLGYIDLDENGLLASFFRRASDELRARLVWFIWRWVGSPENGPEIVERGIRFAEARLAIAEAANQRDPFKLELSRFSTWLEAPRLDTAWLLGIVGRIADLGLIGVGIFATLRWLETICEAHPDAALETASRVVRDHDADGHAMYGSAGQLRAVLKAAVTRGSSATVQGAVELANALEVRGITGMYDYVTALLAAPPPAKAAP